MCTQKLTSSQQILSRVAVHFAIFKGWQSSAVGEVTASLAETNNSLLHGCYLEKGSAKTQMHVSSVTIITFMFIHREIIQFGIFKNECRTHSQMRITSNGT